ncbi:hypothetical protein G7B40_034035 [Aetokthonos hydrillicola Thurmond2011]|uniref:Uncharacterized protein n=1 Tax=Aetokthonos hydrillicola Thurmond2011 TaxID=2712845 RepID=A0AAP5IE37_9CYAN|nr:hypothetical protein [Aetokthonos hydrillicola]MBO3459773.1 hypothetical protein [Aetokthonos hydrillicola CCALA 1050]MBW4585206.1 hypothetical protein [Aetokthonos hydrillicola CCALA 1050]MDR9899542.1 hypothetical protein [Aetokthonos hydrillicola Thurmond2011]
MILARLDPKLQMYGIGFRIFHKCDRALREALRDRHMSGVLPYKFLNFG